MPPLVLWLRSLVSDLDGWDSSRAFSWPPAPRGEPSTWLGRVILYFEAVFLAAVFLAEELYETGIVALIIRTGDDGQ